MTEEQCNFLAAALDEAGVEHDVMDDYSGRGMYGERTKAIVVCSSSVLLAVVVEYMRGLSEEEIEQVPELPPRGFRQDQMGRDDIVLY